MRRTIRWFLLLWVLLAACWACRTGPPPTSAGGDLATMLAGLPQDEWELYGEVLHYTPENVYELIDGRAELYLSYDMVSLTYASFDHKAGNRQSINLSVYDMGTPLNAFGVFSVERSPGEAKIDLGREAYRSYANYYIWHGRYYVQLVASDSDEALRQAGLHWARRVVEFLPDIGEPVWGLSVLPKANLIEDSVRYFQVDAMGLEFMRNTFTAQYRRANSAITVFISQRESSEMAHAVLQHYQGFVVKYGRGIETERSNGTGFLVCDMGDSFDVVSTKGSLVCGVTAVKRRDQALREAITLWRSLEEEF